MDTSERQEANPLDSSCTFTITTTDDQTQIFDLDVKEDIAAELDHFVRLAHLKVFDEARSWFQRCLIPHYDELRHLAASGPATEIADADTEELDLLWYLFRNFAILHPSASDGSDTGIAAVSAINKGWDYLHRRGVGRTTGLPSAIDIHIVEVYLGTTVAVYNYPDRYTIAEEYMNPPWSSFDTPPWRGFGAWYAQLRQNGRFWEAQRILAILFPMLSFRDALNMFMQSQFTVVENKLKEGVFDEPLVLSELISSNHLCEYILECCDKLRPLSHSDSRLMLRLAKDYLKTSRSLRAILIARGDLEQREQSLHIL
ncbi:hypothetical protein BJY01DRAFT_254854 [Aspergillus pseudoustus]|uniref:Isoprenoid synthase domain-containing protein n=1 Tax=Aspergillus pseudoustus TaxID=1810923 RepID=A0ABR4ISU2_9EURO